VANVLMVSGPRADTSPEVPAGVTLRPVDEPDLADVGRAYWRTYLRTPDEMTPEEAAADVLAAWRGEYGRWLTAGCLAARVGDEVVGAVLTVEDPPWPDVPRGPFITDLFVVPEQRRRGVARALVRTTLSARGGVGLRVDDQAPGARALDDALGFRPVA
jgi:GNAT superfamily N-acetyltransferase